MADIADRIHARCGGLAGFHGGSATVRLEAAPPAARISLRIAPDDVSAFTYALGLELPISPKTAVSASGRTALWLGPDEWLVIGEENDDLIRAAAGSCVTHSAVDISHRNTAILVSGPGAAKAINAGCPQDLSLKAFPVNACSRTVFGKVEIVLLKTAEEAFRVEVWRSFSEYAFGLLAEGARDAAL